MNPHIRFLGILSVFLLLGTGCGFFGTEDTEETESTAQEGSAEACGNGVCDSVEEAQGLCSVDCENGATGSTQDQGTGQTSTGSSGVSIETVESSYAVADGNTSGFFTSGQEADILLSGVDFNQTGGPLLFNHQTGIATDGTHLVLADRNNNRVLIWNQLPTGNEEPDLVLGQEDFDSNSPGDGLNELNWPIAVSTDGTRLVVADTYNDRILIWNSWPTENGEGADFALESADIEWPWGVWTDGDKFIVSSTRKSKILIWNDFPTKNEEADISITSDDIGTPRNVMSDGTNLVVGDHNAFSSEHGTFFWSEFPTSDDEPYDFFVENPKFMGEDSTMGAEIYGGTFTQEGGFFGIAHTGLFFWEAFPEDEDDTPDITFDSFHYDGGDASGVAIAYKAQKVYVSLSNGNRVVGFDDIPTTDKEPDFAIGSPDINTNTYSSNYFITNPVPASDGEHLLVTSDYDGTLSVWKQLPDESNARPDYVYHDVGGWDNALYDGTFVIVGGDRKDTIYIWNEIPLGQEPDTIFNQTVGSVQFQELAGVALDENYLYVADRQADKIYVWEGIPDEDEDPVYTLESDEPLRLESDGTYLAVTKTYSHSVDVYSVSDLEASPATVGGKGTFNLPQGVEMADGHLFIADTGGNALHIWEDVKDAISGKSADIKLGQGGTPMIGKDTLFWPGVPSYDVSYLWLGEFKFSGRLLRFSPSD